MLYGSAIPTSENDAVNPMSYTSRFGPLDIAARSFVHGSPHAAYERRNPKPIAIVAFQELPTSFMDIAGHYSQGAMPPDGRQTVLPFILRLPESPVSRRPSALGANCHRRSIPGLCRRAPQERRVLWGKCRELEELLPKVVGLIDFTASLCFTCVNFCAECAKNVGTRAP